METLSRANGAFALDLYRALSKDGAGGNLLLSPLSISTALAMVYLGARSRTEAEMGKVGKEYCERIILPQLHQHKRCLDEGG